MKCYRNFCKFFQIFDLLTVPAKYVALDFSRELFFFSGIIFRESFVCTVNENRRCRSLVDLDLCISCHPYFMLLVMICDKRIITNTKYKKM